MRLTMLRILKHGLPTAAILALLGYLMAEVALIWMASQPPPTLQPRVSMESPAHESSATLRPDLDALQSLRYELPLQMAAWGFGLVVISELVLAFWRGKKPPLAGPGLRPPTDAEVEDLLNQLLRQAEEAEAARQAAATKADDTPLPCPDATISDNTRVA